MEQCQQAVHGSDGGIKYLLEENRGGNRRETHVQVTITSEIKYSTTGMAHLTAMNND